MKQQVAVAVQYVQSDQQWCFLIEHWGQRLMPLCFVIRLHTFSSCHSSRFFVFSVANLISVRCQRKTTQRTEKSDEQKRKHNRKWQQHNKFKIKATWSKIVADWTVSVFFGFAVVSCTPRPPYEHRLKAQWPTSPRTLVNSHGACSSV